MVFGVPYKFAHGPGVDAAIAEATNCDTHLPPSVSAPPRVAIGGTGVRHPTNTHTWQPIRIRGNQYAYVATNTHTWRCKSFANQPPQQRTNHIGDFGNRQGIAKYYAWVDSGGGGQGAPREHAAPVLHLSHARTRFQNICQLQRRPCTRTAHISYTLMAHISYTRMAHIRYTRTAHIRYTRTVARAWCALVARAWCAFVARAWCAFVTHAWCAFVTRAPCALVGGACTRGRF